MKYLKQFAVILIFTLAGELMNHLIPLPVPAGIYGMFLMLIALLSGILKREMILETGNYLLTIMPVMFVEPAVSGLLSSWKQFQPLLIPAVFITVISTISVMAVSGRSAQTIIDKEKAKGFSHE